MAAIRAVDMALVVVVVPMVVFMAVFVFLAMAMMLVAMTVVDVQIPRVHVVYGLERRFVQRRLSCRPVSQTANPPPDKP